MDYDYKTTFFFKSNNREYFLFKVLRRINDKDEDDLKFIFNDPKSGTGNIYAEEGRTLKDEDIIYPYGEVSYHPDGSFLHKFPEYPDPTKEYMNPQGTGFRRRRLDEIEDWEPLFQYDIFDYKLLRKKKPVPNHEKYVIGSSNSFFNGSSLELLIILVNESFEFESSESTVELIDRYKGIGRDLDLILAFTKISKKGNYLNFKDSNKKFFSNLNVIHILKKKNA